MNTTELNAMNSRRKYFIIGLFLFIAVIMQGQIFSADSISNIDKINRGITLLNEWGDWYQRNQKGLEYPKVRPNKKTLEAFFQSIEFSNKAVSLINTNGFQNMTSDEIEKVIYYRSQALKYAKSINIAELNSWYPQFGTIFLARFIAGLTDFVNGLSAEINTGSDDNHNQFPKLTVDELDAVSKILSKAMVMKLNNEDINDFKRVLFNYDKRTGKKMKKEDFDEVTKYFRLIYEYNYELGSSLLLSWDSRTNFTTSNYINALNKIKKNNLRSADKIKMDYNALYAASKNQKFVTNDKMQKFQFGRDTILKRLKEVEISNKNLNVLIRIFKEYSVAK
jgi:hypothetical protein